LNNINEDYIIFDCPGQLELYTHLTIMQSFIKMLQKRDFIICGVFLLDVQFMLDTSKFLSGSLTALSVMINIAIPHINLLNKIDLLSEKAQKKLDRCLEPDINSISLNTKWDKKYYHLTKTIGKIVTNYNLVHFLPLNIKNEESLMNIRLHTDIIMNYGADEDIKQDYEELCENEDTS